MTTARLETAAETGKDELTAVYTPFKTFQTSLLILGEGIAPKLDRTAWPSLSGIVRSQVFGAYKFLGLINKDGVVQPVLNELVAARDSPQGKEVLASILKNRYPKVVELAGQNGTIQNLQDAMRELGVSGSTLEKAIRFWVDAAKFANIRYPSAWAKIPRTITGTKKRRVGSAAPGIDGLSERDPGKDPREKDPPDPKQGIGYVKTVSLGGIGTVTLSVSVNPLQLKGAYRSWFYELTDKLDECPTDLDGDQHPN